MFAVRAVQQADRGRQKQIAMELTDPVAIANQQRIHDRRGIAVEIVDQDQEFLTGELLRRGVEE